jgi:hypothetical protein
MRVGVEPHVWMHRIAACPLCTSPPPPTMPRIVSGSEPASGKGSGFTARNSIPVDPSRETLWDMGHSFAVALEGYGIGARRLHSIVSHQYIIMQCAHTLRQPAGCKLHTRADASYVYSVSSPSSKPNTRF